MQNFVPSLSFFFVELCLDIWGNNEDWARVDLIMPRDLIDGLSNFQLLKLELLLARFLALNPNIELTHEIPEYKMLTALIIRYVTSSIQHTVQRHSSSLININISL